MHASIADFLLDIVQNSWEAGAQVIRVVLHELDGSLVCEIHDNGKGMTETELKRALDPFFTDGVKHPGRKVGLGLPFLQQTMDALGTSLVIQSTKGLGTNLVFSFPLDHIDCPPQGDLLGSLVGMFCFEGNHDLVVDRKTARTEYVVSRSDLVDALGSLDTAGSISLLRTYLESLEEDHGQNEP